MLVLFCVWCVRSLLGFRLCLFLLSFVYSLSFFFFFFQAEDGIRDRDVTGVQTCALPISRGTAPFEGEALAYLDSLYRTSLRLTRNPADAEDLLQETYLKAFRAAGRFEPGDRKSVV